MTINPYEATTCKEYYQAVLILFLKKMMEIHGLSVSEAARRGKISRSTFFDRISGESLGNFFETTKAIVGVGGNYEDFFDFAEEPFRYPLTCFTKQGFSYVNRFYRLNEMADDFLFHCHLMKKDLAEEAHEHPIPYRQIGNTICRSTSCFAHFCSDAYKHWMTCRQILSISGLFHKNLGVYLSQVAAYSEKLLKYGFIPQDPHEIIIMDKKRFSSLFPALSPDFRLGLPVVQHNFTSSLHQ